MSIHGSLKNKGKLKRHRSVLTRTEQLDALKDEERWKDGDSIYGLPKVRVRRAKRKKAAKKEEEQAPEEAAAAAEGIVAEGAAPEEPASKAEGREASGKKA